MGSGISTAGIPVQGVVDRDWEILNTAYAVSYDATNNILLTREPKKFRKTTVDAVKRRFALLQLLAKKHAPETLDEIKYLRDLSVAHLQGNMSEKEYLLRIRFYLLKKGTNHQMVSAIERKIMEAERR